MLCGVQQDLVHRRLWVALALTSACRPDPFPGDGEVGGTTAATEVAATTGATGTPTTDAAGSTTGDGGPETATVVHSFGAYAMAPYLEIEPCAQWTLDNAEAIYVNAVTLVNDGGFHHSNWFAVPEEVFAGEDGFFNCEDRGYVEITAAIEGTVVFAQSTQSREELMTLPAGAVIKIPPRHKVIARTHVLNIGSGAYDSELRMALGIVHPREVDAVLAPMHLDYHDLAIPAGKHSRFTGDCSFASTYEDAIHKPFDVKLYYVLPHYHYFGEYFGLQILGGARDGEVLFELDGFNGGANGKAFDPPVDLSGADGLRFACGYNNWTGNDISFGTGDGEMCMMLGLVDSRVMIESRVMEGSKLVGVDGEVLLSEAECSNYTVAKNPAQSPPTAAEKEAPLYVPPTDPGDVDLEPTKKCVDSASAAEPEPAGHADQRARRDLRPELHLLVVSRRQRAGRRPRPPDRGGSRRPPHRPYGVRQDRPRAGRRGRPRGELAVPAAGRVRATERRRRGRPPHALQRADAAARPAGRQAASVDRGGRARQLRAQAMSM